MERFLLEHGEQVVDILGAEVDRLELEIKVREELNKLRCHYLVLVPLCFVEAVSGSETCGPGNTIEGPFLFQQYFYHLSAIIILPLPRPLCNSNLC